MATGFGTSSPGVGDKWRGSTAYHATAQSVAPTRSQGTARQRRLGTLPEGKSRMINGKIAPATPNVHPLTHDTHSGAGREPGFVRIA
jgi:hypothetical protein